MSSKRKLRKTFIVTLFRDRDGKLIAEHVSDSGSVTYIAIPGKRKPKVPNYYYLNLFDDGTMILSKVPDRRISKRQLKEMFEEIDRMFLKIDKTP